MKRPRIAKMLLYAAILLLVLSIILAVVSLFPIDTGGNQSYVFINDTFRLSPNEIYRQGLGSFHGGENISLLVQCPTAFQKNFSIVFPVSNNLITYSGLRYSNFTQSNITYSFTAGNAYYEAVFSSASPNAGTVHFQASVQEPKTLFPYSWLTEPSKILFLLSLGLAMLVMLKIVFSNSSKFKPNTFSMPSLSKKNRRILLILLLLSLAFWFFLLAVNSNPLATFENWYTIMLEALMFPVCFLKMVFQFLMNP